MGQVWLAVFVLFAYPVTGLADHSDYGFSLINQSTIVRNNFELIIASINSTWQRQLMHTQVWHCPYTPLCASNTILSLFPELPQFGGIGTGDFCCWQCKCDQYCGKERQCCPDNLPDDHMLNMSDTCLQTSYKPEVKRGIFGEASCPNNSSQFLQSKCETVIDRLNISNVALVSDNLTNVTYKNVHCALCNGVPEERMKYWKPKLWCKKQADLLKLNPRDNVLSDIETIENCNIIFIPPRDTLLSESNKCLIVKSKCNSTGKWNVYDAFQEKTCSMYTLPVVAENGVTYRNIFCALCNGFNGIQTICSPKNEIVLEDSSSFSAIIAFVPNPTIETKERTCNIGSIYNPITNDCIRAECSILQRLYDNTCKPIVDSIETANYELNVRMFPLISVSITSAIQIIPDLLDWIQSTLFTNFSFGDYVIKFNIVYLKTQPLLLNQELTENTTISFFDIPVKVRIIKEHDPESLTAGIVESLNNNLIRINVTPNVSLSLQTFVSEEFNDFTFDINKLVENDEGASPYDKCVNKLNNQNSLSTTHQLEQSAQYDSESKQMIIPMITETTCILLYDGTDADMFSNINIPLLSFKTCPVVVLRHEDIPWIEHPRGITFSESNFTLALFQYSASGNRSEIKVCADVLFKLQSFFISNCAGSNFRPEFFCGLVILWYYC